MKNILICNLQLPTKNIGSWTELLMYLINKNPNLYDYIIVPRGEEDIRFDSIEYIEVNDKESFGDKLKRILRRIISNKVTYVGREKYANAVKTILKKHPSEKLLLNIIDNYGMTMTIADELYEYRKAGRIKLVHHMHGYAYNPEILNHFYNSIDEIVYITYDSYINQINTVHTIPCEANVFHLGVDSKLFFTPPKSVQYEIRNRLNFDKDDIIFLWVSQNRPKKGLHIILEAWKEIAEKYENAKLLIVGTQKKAIEGSINWLGRIPNNELPAYYQMSDFYLFSTLCHEAQSMSLTEAIKAGCLVISSLIHPLDEILNYGKYGYMVKYPNIIDCWVDGITECIDVYLKNDKINPYLKNIPERVYDLDDWCENQVKLIKKWKARLSS